MTGMYMLDGKVAVVTGAAKRGGLGRAIAARLAAEGAAVIVSDIARSVGRQFPAQLVGLQDELDEAVAEIGAAGGCAAALPCDVREEAQMRALVAGAVAQFGRLDIFVNNAGIGYLFAQVTQMEVADWDTVLAVNLRGAFLGTKHAALQMIAQGGGGRIINIASQAAKSGFAHAAAYTASKHGLLGLTRSAAIELGAKQITVNAVCPNHVTTSLGAWQNQFGADISGLDEDAFLATIRKRIPLGRVGLPDDTAAACAFLASDQAAFISGEGLNVSGGEEMH